MSTPVTAAPQTGLEHLTLLGVPPPELVTCAARAGFTAVGLRAAPANDDERPWPLGPGSAMLAETVRRCRDTGVAVLDVEAIRLGPRSPDYVPVLETAAELGARFVNAICDDADLGAAAARFAALAEAARPYRVRPVIEFMAYRTVRTLRDAVAIAAGSGTGGILIDALHVRRCRVGLPALRLVDPSLIAYAQLCDAPLACPPDEIREAREARLLPGEGELPLRALVAALPAGIPLTIEAPNVRGAHHPARFAAAARRALDPFLSQAKELP